MTTPKGLPEMTAQDPRPITRREVAEMLKTVRRDLKLFCAAETNALRPRLDRLESAHHLGAQHTHLDSWAAEMAARLDPDELGGL
jgi:hypothetical protein